VNFFYFVIQTGLLWLIYWVGCQVVSLFDLRIPGNVMGILLLFFLLISGIIKPHYIEKAAEPLLKHLVFFYIPFCAAVMNYGDFFARHALILLVALLGSAIVALVVTGWAVQLLPKTEGTSEKSKLLEFKKEIV
jgi:holin-like protein